MKKDCCYLMKCGVMALAMFLVYGLAQNSFAMGRIPKKEHQAKLAELDQTKKDLDAVIKKMQEESALAKAQIEELESKNAQLLSDMDSSKNSLQKRVAELTKEKQDVEKDKALVEKEKAVEVDKLKSTYNNLMTDMKKEIEQGSIQITQLQNKLSVNLVDKILFNSGESEVNDQGKKVLKKVADILKKIQDKQIRIEGHTDNIPIGGALKEKYPTNWELSTARATNVSRYLQEGGGINPKYLSAAGYAEFRPIADNTNAEGRSKNRRIEIVLVPTEPTAHQASSGQAPAKTP